MLNVYVNPLSGVTSTGAEPLLTTTKSAARDVVGVPSMSMQVMMQWMDVPARAAVLGLLQSSIDNADGSWYTSKESGLLVI